ncbi:MAG: hypothetical protein ACOCRK_01145 [bacterium]
MKSDIDFSETEYPEKIIKNNYNTWDFSSLVKYFKDGPEKFIEDMILKNQVSSEYFNHNKEGGVYMLYNLTEPLNRVSFSAIHVHVVFYNRQLFDDKYKYTLSHDHFRTGKLKKYDCAIHMLIPDYYALMDFYDELN